MNHQDFRNLPTSRECALFFAASSTLLVFPLLWGMLADRHISLNRLFTVLNLVAVVALVLLANSKTFWGLLISFSLFSACFNPTLTLINALCFRHLQSPREQFGLLRAWGSAGWMIPSLPIYLWLVKARAADLGFVLYLGAGLGLAMVVMTLFLPHTPSGARSPGTDRSQELGYWPAMKRLLRDANFIAILVSFFLVAASFSILVYYSPPFLEACGIDRAWIGPTQCIGVVFEIILFRWLPRFIDHWSYRASILLGCFALLLRHLLFAWSGNPWLLAGSYLLAGMVIVFYHIGVSILVNAMAGPEVRATAQTLLVLFGSGLGPMFANGVAGRLAAQASDNLRPVFLFAAALAALAAAMILARGSKLDQGRHAQS
ncbi:MAG: MFS transporter [Verrucomicrobiota bacterium]